MEQNLKSKKILIIEDESFISELYCRSLNKAGYETDTVIDGVEALEKAQTNDYDLILLDLMVPNLTGIEILRKLKNPVITPNLKSKIIITTNLEERDDVKKDIEKQADGYIVKANLTPSELVDFIRTIN